MLALLRNTVINLPTPTGALSGAVRQSGQGTGRVHCRGFVDPQPNGN